MRIHSILCPIDFSHCSDAALQHASDLAAESDARLHLLHVVDESAAYCTEFTGMGYMPDMSQSIESESQHLLEAVAPTAEGVSFERHLLLGTPAKAIVDYADQHQIGLIVMGSHGRTGVARLLMGSVAEAVVRAAGCPVLTVKQPTAEETAAGAAPTVASHAGQPTSQQTGAKL